MADQNVTPTATEGGLTIPEASGATASKEEAKTFTQEQVDRIVQDRLARTKAELEAEKGKNARQEFEHSAREVLKQHKLSDELLTVLNVSDLDGLKSALDILDKEFHYSNPHRPYLPNGDGTWRRLAPGEHINLPPAGRVDMKPGDPIRAAMGLPK